MVSNVVVQPRSACGIPPSPPAYSCVAFESGLGWLAIRYAQAAPESGHEAPVLQGLVFGHSDPRSALQRLVPGFAADQVADYADTPDWIEALERFAAGRATRLDEIPVDQSHLTDFGRSVAQACRAIPWGETATYGELAAQVGRPRAARAVGAVMASNRTPLVVPCHRVLGAGGRLGGFSAPDGIKMKRRLLDIESAEA